MIIPSTETLHSTIYVLWTLWVCGSRIKPFNTGVGIMTYTYVHTYIHTYLNRLCRHIHIHISTHIYVCAYIYICIYLYACIGIHIHMYMPYACSHTHMHMCKCCHTCKYACAHYCNGMVVDEVVTGSPRWHIVGIELYQYHTRASVGRRFLAQGRVWSETGVDMLQPSAGAIPGKHKPVLFQERRFNSSRWFEIRTYDCFFVLGWLWTGGSAETVRWF